MENKKNIMVIGAAGSLGSCLCKSLVDDRYKVVAVDINENSAAYLYRAYGVPIENIYIEDIMNFDKIKNIIDFQEVDLVVNCAALKHVLWCEYGIKKAININILANLELINYMHKIQKEFIYISSDKATEPKNIYALTKQFTDYMVKFYNFKLIRGVNFINSKGSVIDIWEQQRIEKTPFTVVDNDECNRFFIPIPEMCDVVKYAIEDSSPESEYFPDKVYKIYIKDLFEAYLKANSISDYEVKKVPLNGNEKVTEDLCFDTEIIEVTDTNSIINLIKE